MKNLSLNYLPKLAIAEGASTPAATGATFIESTVENCIMFWDLDTSTWKILPTVAGGGGGSGYEFAIAGLGGI